ncbi:MAG: HI0074 family nucleotidyltransferase substrate-binding subunit [Gammaproteobacteria bacterium]
MSLDLTALQKACFSLEEAVTDACDKEFINGLSNSQYKLIIAGVIQNFKFTYELCWKFIRRWLSENLGSIQADGVTRRELFRLAAEHQLIKDVDEWMFYHAARNQTSHIYDENIAQEIFDASKQFSQLATRLLKILETKND